MNEGRDPSISSGRSDYEKLVSMKLHDRRRDWHGVRFIPIGDEPIHICADYHFFSRPIGFGNQRPVGQTQFNRGSIPSKNSVNVVHHCTDVASVVPLETADLDFIRSMRHCGKYHRHRRNSFNERRANPFRRSMESAAHLVGGYQPNPYPSRLSARVHPRQSLPLVILFPPCHVSRLLYAHHCLSAACVDAH